jgi:pimeloyl-ACP methyl ester carboxylesterase
MPEITANGITLYYERTGGDKPPVVLLHGITDTGRCWPRLVEALREDFDLIGLDARGHGHSAKPHSGYTPENMAADVAGAISGLGLSKPALLGHSMGAMTASVTAAIYPDLVGCAILEDPPWREQVGSPAERAALAASWRDWARDRKSMTLEQMIEDNYRHNPQSRLWNQAEYAPWYEAKQLVSLVVFELVRNEPFDYRNIVPRLACQTLLITADPERGAIVTPAVAEEVASLNPLIQTVYIPGAGHNIRREKFDDYIVSVKRFLESVGYAKGT